MADAAESFKAEYVLLQGFYEDYDKRALALKALATPLLGTGLAVGLKELNIGILAATIAMAASLWLLEAIWKSFQYCHTDRLILLEKLFRSGEFETEKPFQIFESWGQVWRRWYHRPASWLPILRQPFVCLPYVAIITVGIVGLLIRPATPPAQRSPVSSSCCCSACPSSELPKLQARPSGVPNASVTKH